MSNPLTGLIAGLIAATVCASLWTVVTVATEYQISFMAIGVGFACGLVVAMTGGQPGALRGVLGAGCALVGCVLGNLLSAIGLEAKWAEIPYLEMYLREFDWALSGAILEAYFSPIDLLFYGLALWFGFKLAAAGVDQVEE